MSDETKRPQNVCLDCGETWYPRGRDVSNKCPKCKRSGWIATEHNRAAMLARKRAYERAMNRAMNIGCLVLLIAGGLFYGLPYLGSKRKAPKQAAPGAADAERAPSSDGASTRTPTSRPDERPAPDPQEEAAAAALVAAEKLVEDKKYPEAVAAFEQVARAYPTTPSGAKADARATTLRADKGIKQTLDRAEQETKARQLWGLVENYVKNRMPAQARAKLEQIVKEYPDTEHAQKARERLAQLDKAR